MLSMVTLPTPSNMLAGIGTWSSPIFTDFLPFIEFVVGVFLGVALIAFLYKIFAENIYKLINRSHFLAKLPFAPALDHWSFRQSPEGKRFMQDI